MARTVELVSSMLQEELNITVFESVMSFPPGRRTEVRAQRLWVQLRREMGLCDFFVFIYAGVSEGGAQELRNAELHNVPTLILVQSPYPRHELSWFPSRHFLGHVEYTSPESACDHLRLFLYRNSERLATEASRLRTTRTYAKNQDKIGRTISFLRNRNGWSRSDFAQQCGMTVPEIAAIETDIVAYSPSILDLAGIASVFGMQVSDLFLSPEKFLDAAITEMTIRVASEDKWLLKEYDDYRKNLWHESRKWTIGQLNIDDVRKEMTTWRQSKK